ncbi:hypothetical protein [Acinetobacter sp.]|uniref:hypothetical protein n=1 Tax=Acinetobacter sp. TaxID=472 RepID=UPI00389039D5
MIQNTNELEGISMNKSDFSYTATLKVRDLSNCAIRRKFPGVSDLTINSRTFANYFDCSNSVRALMNNIAEQVNTELAEADHMMVMSEVNPIYTGVDSKSKEWGTGELARIWMFDAAQEESASIHAVAQARVFMKAREPDINLN